MLLGYFTEDAYERLYDDANINKDNYSGNEEWIKDYFGRGNEFYGLSSVEVNKFTPYCSPTRDDDSIRREDYTNAIQIYEAFKNLTPLQATNKYMWSYLCHMDKDCRQYIQRRWSNANVQERYFVPSESNGLYFFNALSRLWWWAHFTYDSDTDNHYVLTEILFKNQMLGKDLLDTLNRSNFTRMKGILLAFDDFSSILGRREGMNQYFRDCKKILNHYAAISMFDIFSVEEIRKITYDTLCKVREQEKKAKENK